MSEPLDLEALERHRTVCSMCGKVLDPWPPKDCPDRGPTGDRADEGCD